MMNICIAMRGVYLPREHYVCFDYMYRMFYILVNSARTVNNKYTHPTRGVTVCEALPIWSGKNFCYRASTCLNMKNISQSCELKVRNILLSDMKVSKNSKLPFRFLLLFLQMFHSYMYLDY